MALKKINAFLNAIQIGSGKPKKTKNGMVPTVKRVEGYLLSATFGIGKTRKEKGSTKYRLLPKNKGDEFEVWGNGAINHSLCVGDDKQQLNPEYIGRMIAIEYTGVLPAKGKNQAGVACDIFVDRDDAIKPVHAKGGKDYKLKNP